MSGDVNLYNLEPKDYTLQSASAATENGTPAALNGQYGGLLVQVVGTGWTGTITFEATQNGTTYITVEGVNIYSGVKVTSVTVGGIYRFDVTGVRKFRAAHSRSAGSVTVTATAQVLPSINLANVLLSAGTANIGDVDVLSIAAGDNNIGNVDLASAIPAGSAIIGKVGIDQTTPGTTNAVSVTGSSVAHDAPSTANPILTGFVAESTIPAAVADGDLSQQAGTLYGAKFVNPVTSAGAQVTGATGAAVPAGAVLVGGVNSSGNLTAPHVVGFMNSDALGATSYNTLGVSAFGAGFNGTTWDRLRSVNTGQLVVTPRGPVGTEVIAATGAAIPAGIIQIGGNDGSTARALKLGTPGADAKAWTATDGVNANAVGYLFNDASFDRQRNNVSATPFTSAARTATSSSADQTNYNGQGVIVTINVSLDPSTASVTFTIEAKDPVSGAYTTVLTSAAIAAVGTTRLRVGSAITAAANVAAADLLGRTWRVTATHADAESITYSVSQETMTA